MGSDAWESYFWPGTNVLVNLLGLREEYSLRAAEYRITMLRTEEILSGEVELPETATLEEVTAIHRYLFADIYPFAGKPRTVGISAGDSAFVDPALFKRYVANFDALVGAIDWTTITRERFVEAAAKVYALVNYLHLFREGNRRTTQVFLARLGERGGYVVDFSLIDRRALQLAAIGSLRTVAATGPDYRPLLAVLEPAIFDVDDLDPDGSLMNWGGVAAATASKPTSPERVGPPADSQLSESLSLPDTSVSMTSALDIQ